MFRDDDRIMALLQSGDNASPKLVKLLGKDRGKCWAAHLKRHLRQETYVTVCEAI